MRRDFRIKDDIYVCARDRIFDVHNDYKFSCFYYDASKQWARLTWAALSSDAALPLTFEGIRFIKIKEADDGYPRREAQSTSFIGFLHPDDIETMDGFLPDDGDEQAHFIVGFQDSSAIKVAA